jgi:hypothetical protein
LSYYFYVKKELNSTLSQCVSVDLIIQQVKNHATHYVYNVVNPLSGATKCSALSHHIYQLQKNFPEHKKRVLDISAKLPKMF